MGDNEEYFPRGGKKPTAGVRFKQSSNFLGGITQEDRKKKKSKKTPENDDGYLSDELITEVDYSYKNCGLWLNYKVVREGLLMLGRVQNVMETKLIISLPCRMQGQVMACHISETYNKQLEAYVNDQIDEVSDLSKMFRCGQYVTVKVIEVASTPSSGNQLMLSLMPQHIHSGKIHSELRKGTILQAAVMSVEDHGYIMDIGVPNTSVFLPKDCANPELDLVMGGVCWCVIKSVTSSPTSSVVKVSGDLQHLQKAVQRFPTPKSTVLPATALEFTVDKPLDNGIEGHIFDNVTAYIQRHHVDKVRGNKPTLGQKIRARLLYFIPPKNIPYLTMKGVFDATYPNLQEEQELNDGDIVEDAQVIKIMGRAVYFKLADKGLGLLSLRRIQVHEDLSDAEVVAKSYPIGSSHRVRVLCYCLADYLYSVSDERTVLKEKYFNMSQLEAGEFVTATVKEVTDRYLKVNVGRLTGLVPLTHMTETGIYLDPKKACPSLLSKKKFKVGQEVNGRVLDVDREKNKMVVTLKPSLLQPDLALLTSYEQAEVGKTYTGVILHISRDYLRVTFFNNVIAYIPRKFVTAEPIDSLTEAFHTGETVKCTILSVKAEEKKMSGSLTTRPLNLEANRQSIKRKTIDTEDKESKKIKLDNKRKANFVDEDKTHRENIDVKKKEKKKKKKTEETDNTEKHKTTLEDSDAIETDLQEEQEVLAPEDLNLIDFSDCVTEKNLKKRVVSLLKAIRARTSRVKRIEKKITNIEMMGLHPKNKKYHTAMNREKLVLQERLGKLTEAFEEGQSKLKALNIEFESDKKKLKSKKIKEINNVEPNIPQKENKLKEKEFESDKKKLKSKKIKEINNVEPNIPQKENKLKEEKKVEAKEKKVIKDKKKENKEVKIKEIDVLDSLDPVVQVASVKDFWSENIDSKSSLVINKEDSETSSSDEEEVEKPKKKRKKLSPAEKVAKAREEEQRIRLMEKRAIDSEAQPRSNDQFQRALLASPDSSQLWIAYMAFHLQATEIDKARAVARKALATINFREEQERLNVWLALLNLEHRFGTKESQQKTLEEALQMNDTYKVHTKLLDILVDTSKQQELASLVELMMRKYRAVADVYRAAGAACYSAGLLEKARHVMQKGIAALEKKEHVSLLVNFAKLERSAGERERSEALCEQVLAVYPQRVDVAAAYLDMLLKSGLLDQARQVLERLTSLQLPARKMKVLYKKWIELEERNGDDAHIQSVRQRAKEFLEKAKF